LDAGGGAFALELRNGLGFAAVRTKGAIGPAEPFEVLAGFFLSRKMGLERAAVVPTGRRLVVKDAGALAAP
jgi:hypothetical protein